MKPKGMSNKSSPSGDSDASSGERVLASDTFAEHLSCQVSQEDVLSMLLAQKEMLARFEKTNEMLVNCNALAAARVDYAHLEFRRHTQLLVEMKKDLDIVFRRIRKLKVNLGKRYPEAFAACSPVGSPDDEEDPSHPSVGAQPPGREVASRDAVQGRSATASAKDLASTRSLSATS